MTLYQLAISIHVVTAVLGIGQVAGIAVLASSTPVPAPAGSGSWTALQRLSRGTTWSLVIMLLSGALIEYASGGAYHEAWWFRLSFVYVVVLGAISGGIGRALRRRESAGEEKTRKKVVRSAWIMCAITAVVTVLMEVKPW
jgi:hypothetical protein